MWNLLLNWLFNREQSQPQSIIDARIKKLKPQLSESLKSMLIVNSILHTSSQAKR